MLIPFAIFYFPFLQKMFLLKDISIHIHFHFNSFRDISSWMLGPQSNEVNCGADKSSFNWTTFRANATFTTIDGTKKLVANHAGRWAFAYSPIYFCLYIIFRGRSFHPTIYDKVPHWGFTHMDFCERHSSFESMSVFWMLSFNPSFNTAVVGRIGTKTSITKAKWENFH